MSLAVAELPESGPILAEMPAIEAVEAEGEQPVAPVTDADLDAELDGLAADMRDIMGEPETAEPETAEAEITEAETVAPVLVAPVAAAAAMASSLAMAPVPPPSAAGYAHLFDSQRLIDANINPETGLATDYLNHFNEIVMMLELLPAMPDMLADIMGWKPATYTDHFFDSSFHEKGLAIAAYSAAPDDLREALDQMAGVLNNMLLSAREALRLPIDEETQAALCNEVVAEVRPLIACAGAIINGKVGEDAEPDTADSPQDAIDALMVA
jgi:hypothetical protein